MKLTKELVAECTRNAALAYKLGLRHVSTTSESNGYPSNVDGAIISDSIQELIDTGTKLMELGFHVDWLYLHKKDGWDLWHRTSVGYFELGCFAKVDDQDFYFDYDPEWSEYEAKEAIFEEIVKSDTPDNYGMLCHWVERVDNYYQEMKFATVKTRFFLDAVNDLTIEYSVSDDQANYSNDTHNYQLGIAIEKFSLED